MDKTLIIVTGTIGSGKSTVLEIFHKLGFQTLSADKTVHSLLADHSEVKDQIISSFGTEILTPELSINRQTLAKKVFNDKDARQKLEKILHPKVREHFLDFFSKSKNGSAFVYEVPLHFESGSQYPVVPIVVVVVTTNEETAMKRLMENRGMSEEEFLKRKNSQMSMEEKVRRADYVIANDHDIVSLEQSVKKFIDHFNLTGEPANKTQS